MPSESTLMFDHIIVHTKKLCLHSIHCADRFSASLSLSGSVYVLRDWSLITGRGGLQNGKITGPKLFAPPPPQDRVKLFAPHPLLKSGNFLCPPTIWLKYQATA